ncbi:MAG: hypothetical protein HZA54_17430 [Planctomycetes bacterium]|nr:hypothetical protein [Planctomycetota bacterium]
MRPSQHSLRALRRLALAALALAASGLAGCIDIEQDILVTPAGSGWMRLRYAVHENALSQLSLGENAPPFATPAAAWFDPAWVAAAVSAAGLHLGHADAATVGHERRMDLLLHFNSPADLARLGETPGIGAPGAALLPGLSLSAALEGGRMRFVERFDPGPLLRRILDGRPADPAALKALAGERRGRIRVHLPGYAIDEERSPRGRANGSIYERGVRLADAADLRQVEVAVEGLTSAPARFGALCAYAVVLLFSACLAGPLLFGWPLHFKLSM